MKKTLIIVLLFCIVLSGASATYDFGNSGVSFTWAPVDPLYKESRAYPFANNVAFRYMMAPEDTKYLPTNILVSDADANNGSGGYKQLPFRDPDTGNNTYWNLKAAVNAGLFRFSWEDYLALEMYLHGGLNTVFGAYGGVDVLGFDGFYGAGVSLDVFNIVTLRFGFHHFSGHWGDEALNDFYSRNEGNYSALTEYTRNNSWLLNISIQPVKYFRIFAELDLPQHVGWIRPAAHVPADTIKNTSEESPDAGKPLSEYIYGQEGLDGKNNNSYPSSYKAMRIGLGAELEIPVPTVGLAYLAFDMQFHQDGKINLETLEYEEDRPWDMEYTLALGLSFQEREDMPEVTLELGYHDGRFPLLNYFFQRSRYFSAGLIRTL